MKARLRKIIVIALVTVCFGSVASVICLDEYFYRTHPRQSEPQAGRIYPQWIYHGARVYLTRVEKLPFDLSWYVGAISAMTAYFLNERWKVIRNPRERLPKKLY